MGRHGGGVQKRRGRVLLLVLVPVLVAVLAWQGWIRFGGRLTGSEAVASCGTPADVRVTTTAALRDAVERVAGSVRDACATFTVTAEPAALTAQRIEGTAGDAPAVWLPDSRLLAQQVASAAPGVTVGRTVASTPVLLAVPEGLTPPKPATWGATIVADDTRLPDPTTSTVGSIALMVGLSEIDALPAEQRAAALAGVGGMLSRVVPEETLLTAHAGQTDTAIFPTTEQQVARAGVSGLDVRTAESTTPALEYPVVTTPTAPGRAVTALTAALTSAAGQRTLREAGFRTPSDPSPVVDGGPPAAALAVTPSPAQVEAAQQMWKAIATPTRLLTVIDTSGSMSEPASSGTGSRIAVASQAASGAIQLLADHNAVGLWTFSTHQAGNRDWTELQPVAELGADDQRSKLAFALGSLGTRLGGDTGLYDTIDAAYASVMKSYDPGAVNLVALFTDGVNDDPGGGLSLAELRARLGKLADPAKPVTVLLVGMGGVDTKALAPVAAAIPRAGGGGGAVFTIRRPQDIADVYVTMLLRRLPRDS